MPEGIWIIEFVLGEKMEDGGFIVFRDREISGGRAGFAYKGHYAAEGNFIQGSFAIMRFGSSSESILGPEKKRNIDFRGEIQKGKMKLDGKTDGLDGTIVMKCTKV